MKASFSGMVRNILTSRAAWIRSLIDPRKDIDAECGYPQNILLSDYSRAFRRGDLAARVIRIFPEECWSENPDVFETEDEKETEFEKAWGELERQHQLYTHLQRIDVLSGIGRFGVLLLGVGDGLELDQPVVPAKGGKKLQPLYYLRSFDESLVTVKSLVTDITNSRYGQPEFYNVQFADNALGTTADTSSSTSSKVVHWSRVIHVADNRTSSDVWGSPRLEVVFDRLLDLKKIAGGSAEMFWKGGFPGISLETSPGQDEDIEFDAAATQEQMDAYMNGLQRYIALVGMSAKSLTPQVADPVHHVETQIRLIAMALGVPWRILMGVEVGQLAGEQDMRAWNRRLSRRREEYLNPFVIKPFVDRLIAFGVLPEPGAEGYQIQWSDLNSPSDLDKASVGEKQTNAMAKYVQGGVDALIKPFHYLTLVLDYTDEEASAIIEAAGEMLSTVDPDTPPAPRPSGQDSNAGA